LPSDLSLAQSLAWITSNAVEGGNYAVTLRNDETIGPQSLSYSGKNVNITLNGGTSERWVILSSSGSLFTVRSGVTLTLDNNVTLQGRSNNTASLVMVGSGGTLLLKSGSKITGNTSSYGGGVYVSSGTFTMSGGTVSGNIASSYGGGVFVSAGTFTMSGGTVSGNTSSFGGGVFVYGTFTMSGGTVSGNTASSSYGGGVYVASSGTFTMSGGTVSGNTASSSYSYGGGVYVNSSGLFIKQSGGTIYGSNASDSLKNTAYSDSYGHAVYVATSPAKKRNTTAGSGVTLNSGVSDSAGGWE
jgi:parallel beta-helix repeat protein